MKKVLTVVAAMLMVFALAACSNNGDGKKVIVKTSAGNITKSDFYNKLKSQYGKQVLQLMVYKKLLDKKYDVSKKLDDTVKKIKDQSGDQFKTFLKQRGFQNEDQLKETIKFQLLMQKAAKDEISKSDLKDYYKQNKDQFTKLKISHILVKKKSTAQKLEDKLKNGADFASLAKQHSIDKASGKKGGSLGYIPVNTQNYDPTFMAAAKKLKVGEVSKPVQTRFGWHIIKVSDKKTPDFKKVKDQIQQTLVQQKMQQPQEIFNKLNKSGKVDVKIDEYKDLFKVKKQSNDNSKNSNK
ncbi:MAG TPA: peptidylprolyl isomerase [Bacillales bacterium]|nr:peptidylprolyl isomerase [Bacillales bacterium]